MNYLDYINTEYQEITIHGHIIRIPINIPVGYYYDGDDTEPTKTMNDDNSFLYRIGCNNESK